MKRAAVQTRESSRDPTLPHACNVLGIACAGRLEWVCVYIYILYIYCIIIYVYIVLGPALRRHVYKAVAAVRVDLASGGVGGGGLE